MSQILFLCTGLIIVDGADAHAGPRADGPASGRGGLVKAQQEALPPVSEAVRSDNALSAIWNAIDTPLQGRDCAGGDVRRGTDPYLGHGRPDLVARVFLHWVDVSSGSGGSMFFTGLFRELLQGAIAITIIQAAADLVVPAIQGLPGELATLFATNGSPQAGGGVAAACDQVWNTTRSLGHLVEGRIYRVPRGPAFLTWDRCCSAPPAVGFVFIAWAFFIVLCTHIVTTILVVAGALFIGLAAFPTLRRYAWGWLSALLATIATVAFLSLILGLTINVITQETKALAKALPDTTDIFDQIDGFLGVVGCLFLLGSVVTVMPFVGFAIFGGVQNTTPSLTCRCGRGRRRNHDWRAETGGSNQMIVCLPHLVLPAVVRCLRTVRLRLDVGACANMRHGVQISVPEILIAVVCWWLAYRAIRVGFGVLNAHARVTFGRN